MLLLQPRARREKTKHAAESLSGYLLATPATISLVGLLLLPVVAVLLIALTDWQFGARTYHFVGMRNFRALWEDPDFRQAFWNTLVYVGMVVPGAAGLGLITALMIESHSSLRTFYRAVNFVPFVATTVAAAIAWETLLHPTVGLVNHLLATVGLPGANWLRDPRLVLPSLATIGIWQYFGFAMVLFLVGLKAIPQDLYEAAELDGADGTVDRFLSITWPMLGPIAMFISVVLAIRAFHVFSSVAVLTQGGPDKASEVLLHELYVENFQFLRTGYGSALTIVYLGILLLLTSAQTKAAERRVHYL